MPRKKGDNTLYIVFGFIGLISSLFFIIISIVINRYYLHKYVTTSETIRVSDSGNIIRYFPYIIGVCIFTGMAVFFLSSDSHTHNPYPFFLNLIFYLCFIIGLLGLLALSARIGISQIGMLINKRKNILIIPTDPNKNTLYQNLLGLQLFKAMFTMEELPLNEIYKITREFGKKAFIHGNFGTRCITWRDKQKRDECIVALELACGKKLASYDRGL